MSGPSGPLSAWRAMNLSSGSQGSSETKSLLLLQRTLALLRPCSVPNIGAISLRGLAGAFCLLLRPRVPCPPTSEEKKDPVRVSRWEG